MQDQFYDFDSKSKIQADIGRKLFLDINYDIFKNNFDQTCHFYKNNSYDFCKETAVQEKIMKKFNCTVPFLTSLITCVVQKKYLEKRPNIIQSVLSLAT